MNECFEWLPFLYDGKEGRIDSEVMDFCCLLLLLFLLSRSEMFKQLMTLFVIGESYDTWNGGRISNVNALLATFICMIRINRIFYPTVG